MWFTGCCLWLQAVAGVSKLLKIECRRALVKNFLSKKSHRIYYKYFHDVVDRIHEKRIWRPCNQCGSICLHLRRHIWNSRTSGASRHRDTRDQRPNSPCRRSRWKTYRPAEARIYHSCVELRTCHFIAMDSGHLNQLLNTSQIMLSTLLLPREADDAGLAQFDFTPSVSSKNWLAHFRNRGWRRLRYLPPR